MPTDPTPDHPVDADGRPEGPVQQAVEKSKNENRVKAGLALAAVGIVVAVVLARRSSAATNAAGPNAGGMPAGAASDAGNAGAGSGIDTSYVQNLQGQLGGLQSQLSGIQSQVGAQSAADIRSRQHQEGVLRDLLHRIDALQRAEAHTGSEQRAQAAPPRARPAGGNAAQQRWLLGQAKTPQQRADLAAWLTHDWSRN